MMTAQKSYAHLSIVVYHFTVLTVYALSLKYDDWYVASQIRRSFGGRWKYLTFLNEVLQTVYFAVASLNDVFGSEVGPEEDGKKKSGLQKLRDIILTGMAFPMGVFVVVTFWGLYVVDRELVFPKELDKIIPSWLNHVMHTTVLLFLMIEMVLVCHRYPGRKTGLTFCLGFATIYQLWIFWIAYYAEIWVYPILAVLSWPWRVSFCAGCWTLVVGFYFLGEIVNKKRWGDAAKTKAQKIA